MQFLKQQKHYRITLELRTGITRSVDVKASSREIAERRALKRNPEAVRIKPHAI